MMLAKRDCKRDCKWKTTTTTTQA